MKSIALFAINLYLFLTDAICEVEQANVIGDVLNQHTIIII